MYVYLNNIFSDCLSCSPTPNITNSEFVIIDRTSGSMATLSCHLPYILNGNPVYTCECNGQWIGSGTCRKLYTLYYSREVKTLY